MEEEKKPVNWPIFALSCVTRVCFWGTTIFIVYLCFKSGYSYTTIHVATCTAGCGLLMVEAILLISGDALLVRVLSRRARIRLHWMIQFLGLEMVVIGVAAMIYTKMGDDSPHFTSNHGKLGLTAAILSLVVGIAAVPTLHEKLVPDVISIGSFKRGHIYLGIISLVLLYAGQITGLYTFWWTASTLAKNFTLAAYVIGAWCLLARPCYTTLKQSFHQS